jgi:hypothetical protein
VTTPTTVNVRLKLRRDTAANWTSANPTLLAGEAGIESDTNRIKIGTGSTAWSSLGYFPFVVSGGVVTGNLEIGSTGSLSFEGSTADAFETTLGVINPTADRTINLPNQSGTVLVSGNASIVNADISATAEIAVSKLADGDARQLLQTDAAGTGVEWTDNVDVPGTLDVTGAATFDDDVTIEGDLTVNGTTTTIDTETLLVKDKNIELAVVDTPTDITADGGGITLKGDTDKTINWVDATDAWTLSEHVNIASAKEYRIAGTKVLDATSLGSAVVSSSLTSVGTIGTGTWQGTAISKTYLDATLVSTGDTGTVTSTMILDGTIVNADINASAAIVDTKLDTIATAGKVSNSATTATNANTASAIVARDGSGNFSAGTITAALTGAASANVLKAGDTMTGVLAVTAGTAALPAITPSGDPDTGIYSPGADQLAISTNGSEAARIDSSGRLLVGTSTSSGNDATIQAIGAVGLQVHRGVAGAQASIINISKSRNTTYGSNTIVQDDDSIGLISFRADDGTDYLSTAASIGAEVDGTPGANDMPGRLVFSTTADGASSPTERMVLTSTGALLAQGVYDSTTATAANVNVTTNGSMRRSTSSIKYKTDVETIQDQYADALLECRPVWYRSTCEGDRPEHSWWGFIAEEVAEIDPRLVQWKTTEAVVQENGSLEHVPCDPEPEGVSYDRFVPHLLNLIKRQKEQIEAMEARLSSLESQ